MCGVWCVVCGVWCVVCGVWVCVVLELVVSHGAVFLFVFFCRKRTGGLTTAGVKFRCCTKKLVPSTIWYPTLTPGTVRSDGFEGLSWPSQWRRRPAISEILSDGETKIGSRPCVCLFL